MVNAEQLTIAQRLKMSMGRQVGVAIKLIDKGISLEKVDTLTQRVRILTCQGCDRFEADERQCLECGCKMDYKTTLAKDPIKIMSGETDPDKIKISCPLGKW